MNDKWSRQQIRKKQDFLQLNKNEDAAYLNSSGTVGAVLRGSFRTLIAYLNNPEAYNNNLAAHGFPQNLEKKAHPKFID